MREGETFMADLKAGLGDMGGAAASPSPSALDAATGGTGGCGEDEQVGEVEGVDDGVTASLRARAVCSMAHRGDTD